jgi:hypothetical protein
MCIYRIVVLHKLCYVGSCVMYVCVVMRRSVPVVCVCVCEKFSSSGITCVKKNLINFLLLSVNILTKFNLCRGVIIVSKIFFIFFIR